MDTLHSTLARKALERSGAKLRPLGTSDLVEGLMGWLAHLGMPVAQVDSRRIEEYETERIARDRADEEEQAVRDVVHSAMEDITQSVIKKAEKEDSESEPEDD